MTNEQIIFAVREFIHAGSVGSTTLAAMPEVEAWLKHLTQLGAIVMSEKAEGSKRTVITQLSKRDGR